jgi:nucleotide-binding universal stress UspA family protein
MTATSALNEHVVRDTGAQSIVVGVDWSSGAQLAIDHAARRLAAGGRLIVAHVMTPLPMVATNVLAEFTPQRHASALELVDRLTGRLDVDTDTVVLDGLPAERLASLARHHDADEIVVGSRRLSRIGAALGSVSHALLERADRPVVIVPPPARRGGPCAPDLMKRRSSSATTVRKPREPQWLTPHGGSRIQGGSSPCTRSRAFPTDWGSPATSAYSTRPRPKAGAISKRWKTSGLRRRISRPPCSRDRRRVPSSARPMRAKPTRSSSGRGDSGLSGVPSEACRTRSCATRIASSS